MVRGGSIAAQSAFYYLFVLFTSCLVTLFFFLAVQPYSATGPELTSNGDFSQGLLNWRLEGRVQNLALKAGTLTITHTERDSTVLFQCWNTQALPKPLLLGAEARSQGVIRGERPWHESRIDLVGYDSQGQGFYHVQTRLFGMEGDRSWQAKQFLFHIPVESERICLEISHYAVPGVFQVRNLSLTRGSETKAYHIGRLLLLASWLLVLVWLIRPLYRYFQQLCCRESLLIISILLVAGVLMPSEVRQQIEDAMLRMLSALNLFEPVGGQVTEQSVWALWPADWGLAKYAHMLGFAVLGFILFFDRQSRLSLRIAALFLLAMVTEVLQFFVPLRMPRVSDLVIDGMGIAIGMSLAMMVVFFRNKSGRYG
jgi:VanZ family protein